MLLAAELARRNVCVRTITSGQISAKRLLRAAGLDEFRTDP
ncbi:MAG: hypothetical protein ACKODZ_05300 [Verrucomicrobiota bacterium]